ncbi:uncharacterized protein N7479_009934 [Penicillium vulpinum]|uniref:FAD/NAD(P)-binding domain-containing protein n=1 Tax=Penicillium vulpinum TaxID=29845 RepID=A0A1V6RYH8_9EURO|nr:uncharacterized protein N7479_009934 [Penicillium vulpinum]KAJ5951521.1 hypothetical protein N7479_009934 [Penicillium vulpinum]OQE06530.1 hypothetical protein PENVUL_c017G06724 [Penicillium vulpinum]
MPEPVFQLLPQWHSQPAKLRIICAGAGAAGLLIAYKLQKNLTNYDLICFDKNPSITGTWFENRYPGCACDVPAHAYTYPFEPNPDWSSFYATGPEIRRYFESFAEKYNLHPYIKTNSRILSATWVEEKGIYEIIIDRDGEIIHDWCHVFINGTGFLNNWKWPSIPGLHDFSGKMMHTANWDNSVDWKDKTIAVIGNGSSGIQIIPELQPTAKHLTCFMRSSTWIAPPLGEVKIGHDEKGNQPDDAKSAPTGQYHYTEEEKKRFRDDPEFLLQYRQSLDSKANLFFDVFIRDSEMSHFGRKMMKEEIEKRLGPGHEDLKVQMIPEWAPGCRRITPGPGYLEALVQPNVTIAQNTIQRIVPDGLIDGDGKHYKVDMIVCATGFDLAFAPNFKVSGVNSAIMADEFNPEPKVYLAVTVPKFPNYFIVNGPRGNWGAGSALPSHDVQVDYIIKCIKRMQQENIRALEVKPKPIDDLYEYIDEWHKGSVWSDNCSSWYKNNIIDGKVWIWGGSSLHYMKTMKEVRWEHYDIRYKSDNMWAFLGNGRVEAEVLKDTSRLAPYMRIGDVPWEI